MKTTAAIIAGLMVSAAMPLAAQSQALPYLNPDEDLEVRVQDALNRMTTHEKVQLLHAQSKFTSAGVPRLGIRQLNMSDGPHGVREELEWNSWKAANWTNDSCVAFPSLTCLAATWNRELSSAYGNTLSEEFAYRGKDVMLGPGTSIARTPLCGRNFEYMGEDPYLAGEMAVPYIRAAQANGVACCLKHFALNNQEVGRMTVNVNVSERALREIYLPAFEKCVRDGGLWTIMGSYNKWLYAHCCHNDSLLNGILKREWGFDGAVVSDWGGTHDTWQAATGGLDIEMGTGTDGKTTDKGLGYNTYYLADPFEEMVLDGRIPMSILNDKAARVLRTIFRTSMNPAKAIGSMCSEEHYTVCRQIGEEGIVLLKNDSNLLPLAPSSYDRILVVGDNAVRNMSEGGGSSELKTLHDVSPLDGIKSLYGDKVDFARGYYAGRALYAKAETLDEDSLARLRSEALEKARKADLVIFIGGLNKNGYEDCENSDRKSYHLSYGQDELITDLAAIQPNIVVVTFGGNAFATPWLANVKAMLHCWYLGSMSGTTLASVLSGDINPSGRLPVTFAKQQDDYGCFQFGEESYPGIDDQVYYKEGIFVGYRWFDTKRIAPQFPFGFGLSYTTFQYGEPTISATTMSSDDSLRITVPIKNTGERAGKEVVQLYIGDDKASVSRPRKELKGFEKVYLQPGETKTVEFTITHRDLCFWSEQDHEWRVEKGRFTAYIGSSSADVRCKAAFKLE